MSVKKHLLTERSIVIYLIGLLVVMATYMILVNHVKHGNNPRMLAQSVEKQLNKLSVGSFKLTAEAGKLIQKQRKKIIWKSFDVVFRNRKQTVVISRKDEILYWNHSDFPSFSKDTVNIRRPVVKRYPSGWFLVYRHKIANYSIHIYSKLQNDYSIHNDFLVDGNTDLCILPEGVLLTSQNQGDKASWVPGYDLAISASKTSTRSLGSGMLLFLFFAGYLLIWLLLWSSYHWVGKYFDRINDGLLLISFLLDVILLRVIDYSFSFPAFVKQLPFFSDKTFGLIGFNSWGDLALNGLIVIIVLLVFRNFTRRYAFPKKNKLVWLGFGILVLFLVSYLFYALGDSILINNDDKDLLQSTVFSPHFFTDLLLIFILNGFVFVWIYLWVEWVKKSSVRFILFTVFILTEALLFYLIFRPEIELITLVVAFLLMLSLVVWYLSFRKSPYLYTVAVLSLLALTGAFLFNITKLKTINAHQRLTASLLSQKNDPYFEFRFQNFANKIEKDTVLQQIVDNPLPGREQKLLIYLNKNYFVNYFGKYSKQITLCEPEQQLEIQPNNQIVNCNDYFSQLGAKRLQHSPGYSLSLVNDTQESLYYVGRFTFPQPTDSTQVINLYIEFFADFLPKGLGYPELLVDARQNNLHLSGYSFARYTNGMLQYKFGDFLYPVDFSYFKNHKPDSFFFKDAYRHFIHYRGKNDLLIISRQKSNISQWLLPFSMLFLFSVVFVIIFIALFYGKTLRKSFQFSLRARLQLIFFGSVLGIFVLLSVVTLYYFNEGNHGRIKAELKEKAHSVLIELQSKLSNNEDITTYNHALLESYLKKFSMVFFSDINLYDTSGRLIVSSRPEIFEKSLQSKWMNPKAYVHIQLNRQLFYLSHEQIGKLQYYSSYMPLTLGNGREAGILNLPFFARQNEIQHSYYQMLTNLINLFVITGILGFVFMVFLSKILTKPLRILQLKMNAVSIDHKNEMIAWNENDEIGQLIGAYNQMVEKLEHSAEILKMSEREKAWREMARQIAHEIRNPLTPMKLNVQYLEKAYQQGDEQFGERIKNISNSLISQIDTLNEVAGMFSDFSKTGLQQNQNTDLIATLESSIALFKKSYKVEFTLDYPTEKQVLVNASAQDLLRIFTNLIKNAIQAMENKEKKSVKIKIYAKSNAWWMEIIDSGKGINPQYRTRIFQPYFTTKSTGTGLGLAIVKNMMKELGGEVSFESEEGIGTRFFLKFRKGQPDTSDSDE